MITFKQFLTEASLTEIERFLASERPNEWLKYGTMEVYVRRGYHLIDGRAAHTFDVANVNQAEKHRGKGQFRLLLKELKELLEARPELRQEVEGIYVENVGNKRLAASLPSLGFKLVPDREPLNSPSFYLPLAPRPIKEARSAWEDQEEPSFLDTFLRLKPSGKTVHLTLWSSDGHSAGTANIFTQGIDSFNRHLAKFKIEKKPARNDDRGNFKLVGTEKNLERLIDALFPKMRPIYRLEFKNEIKAG